MLPSTRRKCFQKGNLSAGVTFYTVKEPFAFLWIFILFDLIT